MAAGAPWCRMPSREERRRTLPEAGERDEQVEAILADHEEHPSRRRRS